jgi:hypothetical protein
VCRLSGGSDGVSAYAQKHTSNSHSRCAFQECHPYVTSKENCEKCLNCIYVFLWVFFMEIVFISTCGYLETIQCLSAGNAMPVHGLSQRKSSVQQSRSQTSSPKMCKASDGKDIKRYQYREVSPKSENEQLSACGRDRQGCGGCGERSGRCRRAWRWCRCCKLCRRRLPARRQSRCCRYRTG